MTLHEHRAIYSLSRISNKCNHKKKKKKIEKLTSSVTSGKSPESDSSQSPVEKKDTDQYIYPQFLAHDNLKENQ